MKKILLFLSSAAALVSMTGCGISLFPEETDEFSSLNNLLKGKGYDVDEITSSTALKSMEVSINAALTEDDHVNLDGYLKATRYDSETYTVIVGFVYSFSTDVEAKLVEEADILKLSDLTDGYVENEYSLAYENMLVLYSKATFLDDMEIAPLD